MQPFESRRPIWELCSSFARLRARHALLSLFIALSACSGQEGPSPVEQAFASSDNSTAVGAAVAFRFPAEGGLARLYRLPSLDEGTWRFEIGPKRPERLIGFVSDDDIIYAIASGERADTLSLIGLDLVAGRARTIDSNVTEAAIGPSGTAFVVHPDGTVGHVEHLTTESWPDTLDGETRAVWGAARGRMLVVVGAGSSRELVLLARGQTPIRQPVPEGELAVSRWSRLVAVAVDSGVLTLDPTDPSDRRFIEVAPGTRLVRFSTSGHKIYAIAGDRDLFVIDRFQHEIGTKLQLPDRVTALRTGPLGHRLLAYSAQEGSVWVVDLVRLRVETTLPGSWGDDLPAIAPDGTILLRRGGTLVAHAGEQLEEVTTGEAGAGDLWLVAQWDPRRPALELARDEELAEEQAGKTIFVQISSSRNAAWAQALADELVSAGMPATVLPADSLDDLYRVVMGPYSTREEAEANARRLDRPFFIREIDTPIP